MVKGRQKSGRMLTYAKEIDEKVLEWVLCKREHHLPVSTQMLRNKAMSLIKGHNPAFKVSEGWLRKFICRHSLVLHAKTSVAQKLPSDLENKVAVFHEEIKTVRKKQNFPKELVGNMDETLYFDSRTLEQKGKKEVRVRTTGAGKRHVTVVLACTASGKTLPPMIIFKSKIIFQTLFKLFTGTTITLVHLTGKTPRVIKGLSGPRGFVLAFQKNGWMDAVVMR